MQYAAFEHKRIRLWIRAASSASFFLNCMITIPPCLATCSTFNQFPSVDVVHTCIATPAALNSDIHDLDVKQDKGTVPLTMKR